MQSLVYQKRLYTVRSCPPLLWYNFAIFHITYTDYCCICFVYSYAYANGKWVYNTGSLPMLLVVLKYALKVNLKSNPLTFDFVKYMIKNLVYEVQLQ